MLISFSVFMVISILNRRPLWRKLGRRFLTNWIIYFKRGPAPPYISCPPPPPPHHPLYSYFWPISDCYTDLSMYFVCNALRVNARVLSLSFVEVIWRDLRSLASLTYFRRMRARAFTLIVAPRPLKESRQKLAKIAI